MCKKSSLLLFFFLSFFHNQKQTGVSEESMKRNRNTTTLFFSIQQLKAFSLLVSVWNQRAVDNIFSGSDEEGGFDTPTKPGGSRMHVPYCIHRDRDLPTNWADQEWKLSQFPSGGCFYIRHQRIKGEQDRAWIWIKLSGKKKKKESSNANQADAAVGQWCVAEQPLLIEWATHQGKSKKKKKKKMGFYSTDLHLDHHRPPFCS